METFYRELDRGAPIVDALATAQRTLISEANAKDPFYWAGFSLVGEARGSL